MPPRFTCFSLGPLCHKPSVTKSCLFHTATVWRNGNIDHYQTLGLDSSASSSIIKELGPQPSHDVHLTIIRKFYSLSKTHHPDHNRNDPDASNRFVKISEAYAIIGNPEKRERYDRERRHTARPSSDVLRGSDSSSGPFGSRPASGLTKRRRTHSRGPPPSFNRIGGWASQERKRAAQADSGASSSAQTRSKPDDPDMRNTGDFGHGRTHRAWSNDVPHFDREGHYRTHEQQEQRRMRRIREDSVDFQSGGTMLINFLVVGGVISFAYLISTTFESSKLGNRNKEIP